MVRALGDNPTDLWLDPCCGKGPFLTELSALGVPPDRIVAIDLESEPGPADKLACASRGIDFLKWSKQTYLRFDKIVANPPYVALSKLDARLQQNALSIIAFNGIRINKLCNYWYAFLCASISLLRAGGSLCFVLPAAWDYANYAAPMRRLISERFVRVEVHRSSEPLFESKQDGSVVVVAMGYDGSPVDRSKRFEYALAENLLTSLRNSRVCLAQPLFESDPIEIERRRNGRGELRQLGDYANIHLGGVTGDAKFFLLTETQRMEKRLPVSALQPVLSKARHLISAEVTKGIWNRLKDADERVWLFNPPPEIIHEPTIHEYLNLGPSDGGCNRNRFKIRYRDPWYRTPLPNRLDGFISGMSNAGPWINFCRMPGLNASNTLYVIQFNDKLTYDEKAACAMSLLSSTAREYLESVKRVYPDGLIKYEPGDLVNVPMVLPSRVDQAMNHYKKAVHELLKGNFSKAQSLADSWIIGGSE